MDTCNRLRVETIVCLPPFSAMLEQLAHDSGCEPNGEIVEDEVPEPPDEAITVSLLDSRAENHRLSITASSLLE
jgi:hypothetical protein